MQRFTTTTSTTPTFLCYSRQASVNWPSNDNRPGELEKKAATFALHSTLNPESHRLVLAYDRRVLGQDALGRHASQPNAVQHKAFYKSKLASNGSLLSIYQGTAPDHDRQAFFEQFISDELALLLPDTAFLGGDNPGEDDFHLAAWLTRMAFVAGGGKEQEGVQALESGFGIKLHPKIRAY